PPVSHLAAGGERYPETARTEPDDVGVCAGGIAGTVGREEVFAAAVARGEAQRSDETALRRIESQTDGGFATVPAQRPAERFAAISPAFSERAVAVPLRVRRACARLEAHVLHARRPGTSDAWRSLQADDDRGHV